MRRAPRMNPRPYPLVPGGGPMSRRVPTLLVNIMDVAHGTDKQLLLAHAHKVAIDRHLVEAGIPATSTNIFWGGRSEIKPSEISPFTYQGWCESLAIDPEEGVDRWTERTREVLADDKGHELGEFPLGGRRHDSEGTKADRLRSWRAMILKKEGAPVTAAPPAGNRPGAPGRTKEAILVSTYHPYHHPFHPYRPCLPCPHHPAACPRPSPSLESP